MPSLMRKLEQPLKHLLPLTEDASGAHLDPVPLPDEPRLSPSFIVNQARVGRAHVQEAREKKKAEKRIRGIASQNVTVEHHHPFSRGVQYFIKFFYGGPNKPHEYPLPPSNAEKESQYWVEKALTLSPLNLPLYVNHCPNSLCRNKTTLSLKLKKKYKNRFSYPCSLLHPRWEIFVEANPSPPRPKVTWKGNLNELAFQDSHTNFIPFSPLLFFSLFSFLLVVFPYPLEFN
jgi:hypothetical protein